MTEVTYFTQEGLDKLKEEVAYTSKQKPSQRKVIYEL